MRLLPAVLLLTSLSFDLSAQTPKDSSAAKAPAASEAAVKFKELSDKQAERAKGLKRGDTQALNEMRKARMEELRAFAKQYAKSPEANKARLETAQLAQTNKGDAAMAEVVKEALAGYDVSQGDLRSAMTAVVIANGAGLADRRDQLIDASLKRANVEESFEIVAALRFQLKDVERADKVQAEIEAGAKTDEDKASVLMGKATLTRRADPKNKDAYKAALDEAAKAYPATKAGRLAASKIAASELKAGSDPVAFTAKDLEGKTVSPTDYKGKVLLIDFWATWCGPCMAELPNVLKAYEEYHGKGFEILGVSLDREGDLQKLESVMKEKGMTWRQIYDGKWWASEIAVLHDVQSIPFTILIGRDGKVVGTNLRGDKLAPAVETALDAK